MNISFLFLTIADTVRIIGKPFSSYYRDGKYQIIFLSFCIIFCGCLMMGVEGLLEDLNYPL